MICLHQQQQSDFAFCEGFIFVKLRENFCQVYHFFARSITLSGLFSFLAKFRKNKTLAKIYKFTVHVPIWVASRQNRSSEFQIFRYSNQPAKLQRLARQLKISLIASQDMILPIKQITKVLIRLGICAGWSAPLL